MTEPATNGQPTSGSRASLGSVQTPPRPAVRSRDRAESIPSQDGESATTTERGGAGASGTRPPIDTRMGWLRTQLSVERTLMAWNRTSLSLIGFGFTIYQFLKKIQDVSGGTVSVRAETPRNFGLAFLVLGTLGTLVALWQHHLYSKYLNGPEFQDTALREGMPHSSLPVLVTVFLALIGIATTAWVLLAG